MLRVAAILLAAVFSCSAFAQSGAMSWPQVRGQIELRADTICLHGDNPNSEEIAWAVRQALDEAGVEARPHAHDARRARRMGHRHVQHDHTQAGVREVFPQRARGDLRGVDHGERAGCRVPGAGCRGWGGGTWPDEVEDAVLAGVLAGHEGSPCWRCNGREDGAKRAGYTDLH